MKLIRRFAVYCKAQRGRTKRFPADPEKIPPARWKVITELGLPFITRGEVDETYLLYFPDPRIRTRWYTFGFTIKPRS